MNVLGRSMDIAVYVRSVTCLIVWISGSLMIRTVVSAELKIDPAIRAELLHCWTCNQTDNCRDMYYLSGVTTQVCRLDQAFCAVVKYVTVAGNVSYARGCQKDCRPECRRITDSYESMQCFSCCSNSLCNSERGSASVTSLSTYLQLLMVVVFLRTFT